MSALIREIWGRVAIHTTFMTAAPPDATALTGALAARDPGQAVPVTVDRGGQTVTVQVTLGELPGS